MFLICSHIFMWQRQDMNPMPPHTQQRWESCFSTHCSLSRSSLMFSELIKDVQNKKGSSSVLSSMTVVSEPPQKKSRSRYVLESWENKYKLSFSYLQFNLSWKVLWVLSKCIRLEISNFKQVYISLWTLQDASQNVLHLLSVKAWRKLDSMQCRYKGLQSSH